MLAAAPSAAAPKAMINENNKNSNDMKRSILMILALLVAGVTTALASNALVVHMKSGETHTYVLLDEEPTIAFSGDNIVITARSAEATYAMSDVDFFNYENNAATSITGVGDGEKGMHRSGNTLIFDGLPAGSSVLVFTLGGQLNIKVKADDNGHAEVDLQSLPEGVYIVKAHNVSTKIAKK